MVRSLQGVAFLCRSDGPPRLTAAAGTNALPSIDRGKGNHLFGKRKMPFEQPRCGTQTSDLTRFSLFGRLDQWVLILDILPTLQQVFDQFSLDIQTVTTPKTERAARIDAAIGQGDVHRLAKPRNQLILCQR